MILKRGIHSLYGEDTRVMFTSSETMPHQLSPFHFAALGHLFDLRLTHVVHVTSAQCHSLLEFPATISSSDWVVS